MLAEFMCPRLAEFENANFDPDTNETALQQKAAEECIALRAESFGSKVPDATKSLAHLREVCENGLEISGLIAASRDVQADAKAIEITLSPYYQEHQSTGGKTNAPRRTIENTARRCAGEWIKPSMQLANKWQDIANLKYIGLDVERAKCNRDVWRENFLKVAQPDGVSSGSVPNPPSGSVPKPPGDGVHPDDAALRDMVEQFFIAEGIGVEERTAGPADDTNLLPIDSLQMVDVETHGFASADFESDANIYLNPEEAWQTLQTEKLAALVVEQLSCHGYSFSTYSTNLPELHACIFHPDKCKATSMLGAVREKVCVIIRAEELVRCKYEDKVETTMFVAKCLDALGSAIVLWRGNGGRWRRIADGIIKIQTSAFRH
jgi:hypothetical protein